MTIDKESICQIFIQKTKPESPNGKSVHCKLNTIVLMVLLFLRPFCDC